MHDAKRSGCSVIHRKPRVMLGREHHVSHAPKLSQTSPALRIEMLGIKRLREFVEKTIGVFLGSADQRVTDGHSKLVVDAPMDKQAKALIAEPLDLIRLVERPFFRVRTSLRYSPRLTTERRHYDQDREEESFVSHVD